MNLKLSKHKHLWLIDLDGTILKHNGYKLDGYDTLLPNAKTFLESIKDDDIIFLTARSEEYKIITEKFLEDNRIKYRQVLFDCPLGERILINDEKPKGLKTAIAVSVIRDSIPPIIVELDEDL